MKKKLTIRLTDGALLGIFISSFIIAESMLALFILSSVLIGCVVLRFKSTPLNPYFFLAPASMYLAANLLYIYFSEATGYLLFFSCASLGLLVLSLALKKTYRIPRERYVNRPGSIKLFLILYCSAVLFLTLNSILSSLDVAELASKVFRLAAYPVVSAVCLGSLVAIASRRVWVALALSSLYFGYTAIVNHNASDLSRLSLLDCLLILLLCFLFGVRRFSVRIISGSKLIGIIFSLFILSQVSLLFMFAEGVEIGGDALIVSNAIETIQEAAGNHEYLMPVFNGGLIFIPDFLWLDSKPKGYNSSAWFIENVMGVDAAGYPWGVGVSLFASSYLYGGLVSVVVVFYLMGIFIGKLSQLVINSFWAGFLMYFLMRFPFSVFRMDETFMLGSVVPMLILLISFVYLFQHRINRIYNLRV